MKTHNVHILSHGNRSAVIGRGETFRPNQTVTHQSL